MFERPDGGDRALIVALAVGRGDHGDRMSEIVALAASAGARVVAEVRGRRNRPDAALFAGSGKVAEIAERKAETGAKLVIFDHALSGVQQRNLEQALACRVVDRTSLILDIFAQRAQSAKGKLQVELAQLNHMATRLVGGWTHLERQKGGIGLRGPGETQLETDRRLIAQRVKLLRGRLSRVARSVATQSRSRRRGLAIARDRRERAESRRADRSGRRGALRHRRSARAATARLQQVRSRATAAGRGARCLW